MLRGLLKHLLRSSLHIRVDVELSKVRIQLFEGLLLGLRVASIHKNGGKDVEGHEDEVDAGTDVSDGHGPDLADDDGTEGAAGLGNAQTLGAAIGGEDLGGVDPGAGAESHAVCSCC